MPEPLTKEEREQLTAAGERWMVLGPNKSVAVLAGDVATTILRYEATLDALEKDSASYEDAASFEAKKRADAEAKVAALEATVAALTPLAETGKAVEGMVVGGVIERYHDETRPELRWSAFAGASSQPYYDEVYEIMAVSVGCAKTIQEAVAYIAEEDAALQAAIAEDAALAAAKGEECSSGT